MDDSTLQQIDELLDGARCWGAELDLKYRVLGLTVEPAPGRHPDGEVDDGRLQLVLHPCNRVQGRLLHEGSTVERFDVEQLVLVVDRLDGAVLEGPVVSSTLAPLAGELSFDGKADVPDGTRHTAAFTLVGDERTLTVRATFDEAELRRPDGSVLDLG